MPLNQLQLVVEVAPELSKGEKKVMPEAAVGEVAEE
jgi:hypothetical protein